MLKRLENSRNELCDKKREESMDGQTDSINSEDEIVIGELSQPVRHHQIILL